MVFAHIPSVPVLMGERKLNLEEAVELHLSMVTMEALNTLYEGSTALALPVPKRERAIYVDKMNAKESGQLASILDAEATLRDIFTEEETIVAKVDNTPVPLLKESIAVVEETKSFLETDAGVAILGCSSLNTPPPSADALTPTPKTCVPQICFVRRKPVPRYDEPSLQRSSFDLCSSGYSQHSNTHVGRRNATITESGRRQPLDFSSIDGRSGNRNDRHMSTALEAASLSDFSLMHYLGGGSQGSVYLAKHKNNNNNLYAVKTIEKETLDTSDVVRARREQKVLKKIRGNPFVLNLRASFEDTQYLYLVTPFYGGGDLQELLFNQQRFTFEKTRFYSAEIILGLEYLHSLGLFHRDIKLSNILLTNDGHVVLADFGLVEEVTTSPKTFCGTVTFMAPEVMQSKPYGPASDVWSLGMAIWAMRTGLLPWFEEEDDDDLTQTKLGIINDPLPEPDPEMEPELFDLCYQILRKDPLSRPSCSALKDHQMFRATDWTVLEKREQEGPWIPDSINGVVLGLGSLAGNHAFEPGSPVDGESDFPGYTFTAPDFPPLIDGSLPTEFLAFLATRRSTTSYLFSSSTTQEFGGSRVIGDGQLSSSSSHSPANSSGDIVPYHDTNSETSSFAPAPTPATSFLFDSQGSHCWVPQNRPAEPPAIMATQTTTGDAPSSADTPVHDIPLEQVRVPDPPPDLETTNLVEDPVLDLQPLSETGIEDASPSCKKDVGTLNGTTSSPFSRLPRLVRRLLRTGKKLLAYLRPRH